MLNEKEKKKHSWVVHGAGVPVCFGTCDPYDAQCHWNHDYKKAVKPCQFVKECFAEYERKRGKTP